VQLHAVGYEPRRGKTNGPNTRYATVSAFTYHGNILTVAIHIREFLSDCFGPSRDRHQILHNQHKSSVTEVIKKSPM